MHLIKLMLCFQMNLKSYHLIISLALIVNYDPSMAQKDLTINSIITITSTQSLIASPLMALLLVAFGTCWKEKDWILVNVYDKILCQLIK